jgi:hypothetical protein
MGEWHGGEQQVNLQRAKRGQCIEIEWWDSCQNTGWQSEKEIVQWSRGDAHATHYTIGYFVAVDEQVLTLVSSFVDYAEGYRSVTGTMSIPLVSIVRSRLVQ